MIPLVISSYLHGHKGCPWSPVTEHSLTLRSGSERAVALVEVRRPVSAGGGLREDVSKPRLLRSFLQTPDFMTSVHPTVEEQ